VFLAFWSFSQSEKENKNNKKFSNTNASNEVLVLLCVFSVPLQSHSTQKQGF
jgi:hypothetical protein